MKTLEFNQNWNNKLACKAFTTLRLHNPEKYYIGQQFEIVLLGQRLETATVVSVKSFTINKLNAFITYLDTGYGVEDTKNIIRTMYKNSNINWDVQLLDWNKPAAVPEMLEALEECLIALAAHNSEDNIPERTLIKKLAQLIVKTKGKKQ